MIGALRGRLLDRSQRGEVVIDVGGVGYRAIVAPTTMAALGEPGVDVTVHTHLHVREDALTLFAFATREERDCFEALIGAHGVGPGLALGILSVHSPDGLRRVLADGDLDALTLVPGVGKKTAARLLMELKARLDVGALDDPATIHAVNGAPSARAELGAALSGLGYEAEEVRRVVRELPDDGDVHDQLRAALKLLAVSR